MKRLRWLPPLLLLGFHPACQNGKSSALPAAKPGPIAKDDITPRFARKDLFGVWEVTDYFHNGLSRPETRLNVKYCFAEDSVYPGLPPDQVNDSAEGACDWFITKNLLIFEGSMGASPQVMKIEKLENDLLVLGLGAWETMTLRRIRKTWEGKTPVLKTKQIPVRGMLPPLPTMTR